MNHYSLPLLFLPNETGPGGSLSLYNHMTMFRSFRLSHALALLFILPGGGQLMAQAPAVPEQQIAAVYGEAAAALKPDQKAWLLDQLSRATVKELPRHSGESYALLSSLPLRNKYIPDLRRDAFTLPLSINPLKYHINFFQKEDQVFRIDDTDYVLFIAGRKS